MAEPEAEPEPTDGSPLFLWPFPGYMVGSCFEASNLSFGVIYVVLTVVTIALLPIFLHGAYVKRVTLCLLTAAIMRAFFYLADPYHERRGLHALVVSYLFGLPYPLVNLAFLYVCLTLYTIIQSTAAATRVLASPGRMVRVRSAAFGLCAFEAGVQVFADTMRYNGYNWGILVICKLFFVCYGLVLALAYGWMGTLLRRLDTHKRTPQYVYACIGLGALAGIARSLSNLVYVSIFVWARAPLEPNALCAAFAVDASLEIMFYITPFVWMLPNSIRSAEAALHATRVEQRRSLRSATRRTTDGGAGGGVDTSAHERRASFNRVGESALKLSLLMVGKPLRAMGSTSGRLSEISATSAASPTCRTPCSAATDEPSRWTADATAGETADATAGARAVVGRPYSVASVLNTPDGSPGQASPNTTDGSPGQAPPSAEGSANDADPARVALARSGSGVASEPVPPEPIPSAASATVENVEVKIRT